MAIMSHILNRQDIAEMFYVNEDEELVLQYRTYTPYMEDDGFVNYSVKELDSKIVFGGNDEFLYW